MTWPMQPNYNHLWLSHFRVGQLTYAYIIASLALPISWLVSLEIHWIRKLFSEMLWILTSLFVKLWFTASLKTSSMLPLQGAKLTDIIYMCMCVVCMYLCSHNISILYTMSMFTKCWSVLNRVYFMCRTPDDTCSVQACNTHSSGQPRQSLNCTPHWRFLLHS